MNTPKVKVIITPKSEKEKDIFAAIIKGVATRYANKLNVSVEALTKILEDANVEIYQEKPFTTAIVKRVVGGRQIRGIGFTKYNLNDSKLGLEWTSSRGRITAYNRAYHAFANMMVEKKVVLVPVVRKRKVVVKAKVKPVKV